MRRLITHASLAIVATLATAAHSAAQAPEIVPVAKGDSVRIFLLTPPAVFHGFNVYGGPTGGPMQKLTEKPVMPAADARELAADIGSDLDRVYRATSTSDIIGLARKLDSDDFAAGVLTFLYPGVATGLARTWAQGGLTPGADYSYRIEYVNIGGEPNGKSVTTHVKLVDIVPETPRNVKATNTVSHAKLTWSYPAQGNNISDLAFGFNVYRTDAPGAPPQKLNDAPLLRDDGKSPAFVDEGIRAGTTYHYTIRALDIVGRESPPSAEATVNVVDNEAPLPPRRLTAVEGDSRVTLVWPMAPEIDAASYIVQRAYGLDKLYTQVNGPPIPVDQPTFTDTTATGGTQLFYRVIVVDRSGNRSEPSNPLSTLPHDRTPPSAPLALQATLLPGHKVRLSWTEPLTHDAAGYNIYRGEGNNASTRANANAVDAISYIDAGPDSVGLQPGRRYHFAVSAIDASFNESSAATIDLAIPDDDPPLPPGSVHATNVLGRYATVGWLASPSFDAMTYEVEREDAGGARISLGKVSALKDPLVRDTAVVLGQHYVYRVIAIDTAGNRSKPTTDSLFFRDLTPPPAPRNATARATADGGVKITWERVIEKDLAGYMVFRSDIPTGVFAPVTTSPVTELTFTDRGSPPGSYYVVRAVDTSGNQSAQSPAVRAPAQ
jgi:fibronectin type 3 domain-containing protein